MADPLEELRGHLTAGERIPLSWVVAYGDKFPHLWSRCTDPELMLRIAAHVVSRQDLVLATCAVARTALKYVPKGELRPRIAIETAERWARGEATIEEVKTAADAADDAAAATNAAVAYAYAPYYAANAAYAAYAPYYAANAARAANAAYYATSAAVRKTANRNSARVIRRVLMGKITIGNIVAGVV
jgi:hypothetical protein